MKPWLSVIIPTYNRAAYVVEAVESVLAQTDRDFELIVVDDGSEDETPRLLESYTDRLRYIRQENRGMAAARNRGIREARGELVGLLDSDDRWEPTFLEAVRRTLERHPEAGAAFVAERSMDAAGKVLPRIHTKRTPGPFFTPAGMIGKDTRVGSGRPPVVRRSLLERHGGYDEHLGGAWDCEMWIRYAFLTTMVLVPEPLILRRIHPGNFSGDRLRDAEAWLEILARVERDHPEFVRRHRSVHRRALGKNHLRLGRELLARSADTPASIGRARRELRSAVLTYPLFLRGWTYLAWSYLAPRTYGAWRSRTLRRR